MGFSREFLDDLRARLAPSALIARTHRDLKKAGREWKMRSPFNDERTPSFTINDDKQFWHDFSTGRHGDIFAWLVETRGLSFRDAVTECAQIAGMAVRDDGPIERREHYEGGNGADMTNGPNVVDMSEAAERIRPTPTGAQVVGVWDYWNEDGTAVLYQTLRQEFTDEEGRHKKFLQRRPDPKRPGEYIYDLKGVGHTLYRLPELMRLRDERGAEEHPFVLMPEGERKVDLLVEWGFHAFTNSGGARNWRDEFAEHFRGFDVVLLLDNDEPGRERGQKIARALHNVAHRVRVLDFAEHWPAIGPKDDVVDWAERGGGDGNKLERIIGELPTWAPPPWQSRMGLLMWAEQERKGPEYEYLVEDLIPEAEPVMIEGESQSGKSFFTFDLAMAVARGLPFFGRRIAGDRARGIIYCAYDVGNGFRDRLRAYRHFHNLQLDDLPFALLTYPVALWSDEVNADRLIEEIQGIQAERFRETRLAAVVIDTHNAATPGASEVNSEDVSKIRKRYQRIMERCGCGVWVVHHFNAKGEARGNQLLYNHIGTVIDIAKKRQLKGRTWEPVRDAAGRQVRNALVRKQHEGMDGVSWDFTLRLHATGRRDQFGKERNSCVVELIGQAEQTTVKPQPAQPGYTVPRGYVDLKPTAREIFRALVSAIDKYGRVPVPRPIDVPARTKCVRYSHWVDELMALRAGEEDDEKKLAGRCQWAVKEAKKKWSGRGGIIGYGGGWYWRNERKVASVDDPPAPSEMRRQIDEQAELLDERDDDLNDLLG